MKDTILRSAMYELSDDTKFIRLATITTFIHSLLFLIYLVYLFSSVISKMQGGKNQQFLEVLQEIISFDMSGNTIIIFIFLAILLFIWYIILPPIGEAAMIYYLDNPKKQGTASLGKGTTKFFPMFEFDAAISTVNVLVLMIAVSRMYVIGIFK